MDNHLEVYIKFATQPFLRNSHPLLSTRTGPSCNFIVIPTSRAPRRISHRSPRRNSASSDESYAIDTFSYHYNHLRRYSAAFWYHFVHIWIFLTCKDGVASSQILSWAPGNLSTEARPSESRHILLVNYNPHKDFKHKIWRLKSGNSCKSSRLSYGRS